MTDSYEKLNNAIVKGAYLFPQSDDWRVLNDAWQNDVVAWKNVEIAVPPLWAAVLDDYWNKYKLAYSNTPAASRSSMPEPASLQPGGVISATADLYAPATDTAAQAADRAVERLTKVATASAQNTSTGYLWGLAAAAAIGIAFYYTVYTKADRV